MDRHALIAPLLSLVLSTSGCGGADDPLSPPPGVNGSSPSAPIAAAATPPPVVTVASCMTVTRAGPLCIEFSAAQYASLGAASATALCASEFGSAARPNVPCSSFDRLGACELQNHVLYGYRGGTAGESDYRRLCGTTTGRFFAGGAMAEPGRDAVHPEASTALTVEQAVLYVCDGCTATRIARVVDVLPDGRVTVEDQGDRATVARDRIWVGSFTLVPDGLSNSDADDFPEITEAPLPAGTEVWAKDTWWYRGVVVEDTGADRVRVDLYGYVNGAQEFRRRNVRLHR